MLRSIIETVDRCSGVSVKPWSEVVTVITDMIPLSWYDSMELIQNRGADMILRNGYDTAERIWYCRAEMIPRRGYDIAERVWCRKADMIPQSGYDTMILQRAFWNFWGLWSLLKGYLRKNCTHMNKGLKNTHTFLKIEIKYILHFFPLLFKWADFCELSNWISLWNWSHIWIYFSLRFRGPDVDWSKTKMA